MLVLLLLRKHVGNRKTVVVELKKHCDLSTITDLLKKVFFPQRTMYNCRGGYLLVRQRHDNFIHVEKAKRIYLT